MKLDIIAHSIVALSMISPTAAQLVCPPSWQTGKTYASGDLVSVDGIVFQVVGPCSGTIAPSTAVPTTSSGSTQPGCPSKWLAGAEYVAGSLVSMNGQILRCKSTAAMPTLDKLCNQVGYEPFSIVYGGAWQHAWEVVGPCSGTIAPSTTVPALPQPGCPSKWLAGAAYIGGSLVSMNCQILKCKYTAAMPTLDKLCNQVGFEPFSTVYGGAWQHAWEVIGPCSCTIAPTSAPLMSLSPTTLTATPTAVPSTSTSTSAPSTSAPSSSTPSTSVPSTTAHSSVSLTTAMPSTTPSTTAPTSLCCSTSGICSNGTNGCESSTSGPICYKKSYVPIGSPAFACGCSATVPVGANGCNSTKPYCVTADNLIGKGCEKCIFGTSTGCNANQTCGFYPGIEGGELRCNEPPC
jgi:hypothetical protein